MSSPFSSEYSYAATTIQRRHEVWMEVVVHLSTIDISSYLPVQTFLPAERKENNDKELRGLTPF